MNIKKFVESVKDILGLKKDIKSDKKKSVKKLLKKLKKRRVEIYRLLEISSKQEKIALKEELEIISLHIHKGKVIFNN